MFNYITNESEKTDVQLLIIQKTKVIESLIQQRELLVKRLIKLSYRNFYDDGTQKPFSTKEAKLISDEIREFDILFAETIKNTCQ